MPRLQEREREREREREDIDSESPGDMVSLRDCPLPLFNGNTWNTTNSIYNNKKLEITRISSPEKGRLNKNIQDRFLLVG